MDVLKLYLDEYAAQQYPLRVEFEEEHAVDCGGVSRDMFSGFWEHA